MADLPTDVESRVLALSWKDPEFRNALLEDPRSALKGAGIDVPDDIAINLVTTNNSTLTLPVAMHPAGASETPGAGEVSAQAEWTSESGDCGRRCSLTSECLCGSSLTGSCMCP
jgi:hypothetical protein